MGFMPNEDAELLRGLVRDFLEKQAPETHVRRWMESEGGYDVGLWQRCARELGLQGLTISEALGGSGATLVELGVAFEEMGRALVCAPFLSTTALATTVLQGLADTPAAAELLLAIAEGRAVVALAAQPGALSVRDTVVSGTVDIVVEGVAADTILIAASTETGTVELHCVDGGAAGLTRTPLLALDLTRPLAALAFKDVETTVLALDATPHIRRALDTGALLLAAEQLGGATRVLETSVDYAKTRVQFGRPIGSFQAVKHRLADMLVEVESARSIVAHALHSVASDPSTLAFEASLARSVASDAYLSAASVSLQIHGGIGFTWEHSAHLHLKRAKSSSILFGTATHHRRRLARHLNIGDAL